MEGTNNNSANIKKKNGFAIMAVILEILVGISFMFSQGPTSIIVYVMFFVAIITAFSAYDESSEYICLKEHKFEVHKRKDVLASIKYSDMVYISYENGSSHKDKKKKFVIIKYIISKKKGKVEHEERYYIDTTYFSRIDLTSIIDKIKKENANVRFSKELNEFLNQK